MSARPSIGIPRQSSALVPAAASAAGSWSITTAPTGIAQLSTFHEKIIAAFTSGRVSFLPYLDRRTEETAAMRAAYPTMMKSPVVKSAVLARVFSVGSLDLSLQPAADTPRDQEAADAFQYGLQNIAEGGLRKLSESVFLPGMIYGTSVTEKVLDEQLHPRGRWMGKRFYRAFKSRDVTQLQLRQDQFGNVTGIRGRSGDTGQYEDFDAGDFIIFRNLPLFEGPGQSDFRAAYGAYWKLDTVEKLRLIHLEKFTSPAVKGMYPQGDDQARQELEKRLSEFQSRTFVTFPDTAVVEAMTIAQRGEAEFAQAVKDLKEDIVLSIDLAFLQMLTAASGGDIRGDSRTQKSTFELVVWHMAAVLAELITRHIAPPWYQENYADLDYPTASLGGVNDADLAASTVIDGALAQLGFEQDERDVGKRYNRKLTKAATPAPGAGGWSIQVVPGAPGANGKPGQPAAGGKATGAIPRVMNFADDDDDPEKKKTPVVPIIPTRRKT